MAFKTICPECRQKLKIEDEMVGVSIRCPKCSHVFVVTSLGKNKTLVTWSGRFKRKNLGDSPPDAESDKAATDAITGVYQSGLENLKKLVQAN